MNHEAIHAELSTIATEYNHSVQQQSLLETYKEPILLLRAKYASYEKITELLQAKGIKVSVATVRKFCRKYQADAKRLRAELESTPAHTTEEEAQPPQEETSTTTGKEKRPPLTTEPGKRGPRTARDTL
jgi:hypothetical protein